MALAGVALDLGDDDADAMLQQALAAAADYRSATSEVHAMLALQALATGDQAAATALLRLATDTPSPKSALHIQYIAGCVALSARDLDAAREAWTAASQVARDSKKPIWMAAAEGRLAYLNGEPLGLFIEDLQQRGAFQSAAGLQALAGLPRGKGGPSILIRWAEAHRAGAPKGTS
jgi:uncharacterized protein YigE (DUF2233 family)